MAPFGAYGILKTNTTTLTEDLSLATLWLNESIEELSAEDPPLPHVDYDGVDPRFLITTDGKVHFLVVKYSHGHPVMNYGEVSAGKL